MEKYKLPLSYNDYGVDDYKAIKKQFITNEYTMGNKVNLFENREMLPTGNPDYAYPNKTIGNVPASVDKPAFDLWNKYEMDMKNEYNF